MRASGDRTGIIAFAVALLAGAGMLVAVPSLLPPSLRNLVGLGPDRIAPARSVSSTGSYAFLAHQPGDGRAPVGYDPCKRIAIRVNTAGAPPDGLALVKQAMVEVEGATGLRFDYQGSSQDRPHWRNEYVPTILGRVRTSPALVSWATSDEVHELAGEVVGVGGSVAVPVSGGRLQYVTGGVTLDADDFAGLDESDGGRQEELAIILHEFGHLVGLGHVKDDHELMNAENVGLLDYGPGDRAGLARVGDTPCT